MKSIKLLFIGVFISCLASAQQEPQFTQYMDNMLYYNPAYAGSSDYMTINGLFRQQWVGIDGAPMTQSLSFHTPTGWSGLGVGVSVLNDKVGPINQSWLNVDVSYTMKFKNHKGKLSFGMKGGINILNARLANLTAIDQGDLAIGANYKNKILPNIGAGVYYHLDNFFVGFAVPRIVQSVPDASSISYVDQRHYYLMVGGIFSVSENVKLRPSSMFKFTQDAPFAFDVSLASIFYNKLWVGLNYRLVESVGAFLQYQFNSQFKLGYAYDFSVNKLMRHNAGTHEIMISYDFRYKKSGLSTPRYF